MKQLFVLVMFVALVGMAYGDCDALAMLLWRYFNVIADHVV